MGKAAGHGLRAGLPLLTLGGAFSFLFTVAFSPTGLTPLASGDVLVFSPREQTLIGVAGMVVAGVLGLAVLARFRTSRVGLVALSALAVGLPAVAAAMALTSFAPATPLAVSLALGVGCMAQLYLGARMGAALDPSSMAVGSALAFLAAAVVNGIAAGAFTYAYQGTAFVACVCAGCGCLLALWCLRHAEVPSVEAAPVRLRDLLLVRYDWQPLVGGALCAVAFGVSWNEPAAAVAESHALQLLVGKALGACVLCAACARMGTRPVSRAFDYALAVAAFSALAFWLLGGDRSVEPVLFAVSSFSQVLFIGLLWVETAYTGRDLADSALLPVVGMVLFLAAYAFGVLLSFAVPASVSTPFVPLGFLAFAFVVHLCSIGRSDGVEEAHVPRDRSFDEAVGQLARDFGLSRRESEVLPFLVLGLSTTAVGERIFVSPQTVKSHAHRIYQKMGIHSHDELVAVFDGYVHVMG